MYVPSQGRLQINRSVDTGNYIMDKQHKIKDKLKAITREKKHINTEKQTNKQTHEDEW
jgi:hypothetical protein